MTTPASASWESLPEGIHSLRINHDSIGFSTTVWKGAPGPTLVINGGTHGDEYEGPTFLCRLMESWRPQDLKGTVVAIPVLNEAAFYEGTRNHPQDGKNLARIFPGRPDGTAGELLAHLFTNQVLKFSDFYWDIHSGGNHYELDPWVGYMTSPDTDTNATQLKMAQCCSELWCWESPYLKGRTISAAAELGVPAIYTESTGAGGVLKEDIKNLDAAFARMIVVLGLTPGPSDSFANTEFRKTTDPDEAHLQLHHPSPIQGLFVREAELGSTVSENQLLGFVYSLDGRRVEAIHANQSGVLVNLRRKGSVTKGEALATLVPAP